ncbi:MAG: glycosyltransferase family 4 protein [Candidatus Planktophila sp.]|jgi:phosphatidyl-myo-inositol dimannoside synthase|tara:strand:- start:12449 stop:13585 length:1137 start_codon:yes stop_codon:yes gene_type:complete
MNIEKILCITNDFGPRAGGIETFVMGLIERLPRNSVIVYTSSQEGSEPFDKRWLAEYGVEVIRDKSQILLPTLRVGRAVRKLAQDRAITLSIFGAAAPLGILSQGLRKAGVKRIIALTHGHEVWWAKVWPFSWILRRIGNSVDHLTYLGDFTRSEIGKALSPHAIDAMVKIAPGIDTEHFKPTESLVRNELGLGTKKVIVSVGRLVHRKGQDILIDALPEILQSIPDTHLLFVGEGPYKKELLKRAEKLSVMKSITFVGRIHYADLPAYFCAGDIFAMPSRSRLAGLEVEGLGIVYLEASSCALPVIAGNSGGAPDAVLEGVTGFAVDGTSPSAVARAVITLLSDSQLAQRMGAQGRQWVIDEWRWSLWAERFARLLR